MGEFDILYGALEVLKQYCGGIEDCHACEFFGDEGCIFIDKIPEEWDLDEDEEVR